MTVRSHDLAARAAIASGVRRALAEGKGRKHGSFRDTLTPEQERRFDELRRPRMGHNQALREIGRHDLVKNWREH